MILLKKAQFKDWYGHTKKISWSMDFTFEKMVRASEFFFLFFFKNFFSSMHFRHAKVKRANNLLFFLTKSDKSSKWTHSKKYLNVWAAGIKRKISKKKQQLDFPKNEASEIHWLFSALKLSLLINASPFMQSCKHALSSHNYSMPGIQTPSF